MSCTSLQARVRTFPLERKALSLVSGERQHLDPVDDALEPLFALIEPEAEAAVVLAADPQFARLSHLQLAHVPQGDVRTPFGGGGIVVGMCALCEP